MSATIARPKSHCAKRMPWRSASTTRSLRAAVAGRALANLSMCARGQADFARDMAFSEEALRLYEGKQLDLAESISLLDLGAAAFASGDYRLAVERWREGVMLAGEHGDLRQVADALSGIANVAVAWGASRAALLLFGAAEALRERMGTTMLWPLDIAAAERSLTSLRQSIGERAVAAGLREGRALSLPEAMTIAAEVSGPTEEARARRGVERRTDTPGARRPAAAGRAADGPRDRGGALPQPAHRQLARPLHPGQARRRLPPRGGDPGAGSRVGLIHGSAALAGNGRRRRRAIRPRSAEDAAGSPEQDRTQKQRPSNRRTEAIGSPIPLGGNAFLKSGNFVSPPENAQTIAGGRYAGDRWAPAPRCSTGPTMSGCT